MTKENVVNKKMRLFENDLNIVGKHATYIKFLVNDAKLYDNYIDVYMNAAVFGYLYDEKSNRDKLSTDRARIYADAFSNHRDECLFLYRIITLLDDKDIDTEERLNRAFRYDAIPEKNEVVEECLENFNAYVRGGVEYMFKLLTEGNVSKDDYIRSAFEASKKFKDSIQGISYEEKIKKLVRK